MPKPSNSDSIKRKPGRPVGSTKPPEEKLTEHYDLLLTPVLKTKAKLLGPDRIRALIKKARI
jgi:hypothetical protein